METKSAYGSLQVPAKTPERDTRTTSREKIFMSYFIGYLGSEIFRNDQTSIGCLQRPLIELFLRFRLNAFRLQQGSQLVITSSAVTIYTNEKVVKNILLKDISSVQLLKIVYEKREKSLCFGFLPIGKT